MWWSRGLVDVYMRQVELAFSHDSEGEALRGAVLQTRADLETEVGKLEKRIREPQPFWETIGRAFLDLGRG